MPSQTDSELNIDQLHPNRIGIRQNDQSRVVRSFCATGELTNSYNTRIRSVDTLNEQTDQPTREFVTTLLAIAGIEEVVFLEQFRVIIEIHSMYTWSQIQEQIIAAILKRLGWTPENSSVVSYDDFQKAATEHDKGSLPPDRLS